MKLREFLEGLSLKEYIAIFGTYWNQEQFKVSRFKLWPLQAELCDHLDNNQFVLVPKARQLGISEIMAERIVKMMLTYDNWEGAVVSKTEDDAVYFLEKRVAKKIKALPVIEGLEYPSVVKMTKDRIELSNGARIDSLPASSGAIASRTGNAICFDECGLIDKQPNASFEDMLNNALPTIEAAGKMGWMMGVGTSEPGSYYNDLLRKVMRGELREYSYHFLPWYAKRSRTKEWKKKQLERMTSEVEFRLKYPENMSDFFAVKEGLIFPNFDSKDGGKHVGFFTPDLGHRVICGYDHGYRHPAVFLVGYYDEYEDHLYISSEKFWYETPVELIAPKIKTKIRSIGKIIWKNVADISIFAQTGVRSIASHFASMGVKFNKSEKHKGLTGEQGSLSLLSARFTNGSITISPECVNLIEQLSTWKWNSKRKGEIPEDVGDDGPDVLRYICAELRPKKRHIEEKRGRHYSDPKKRKSILRRNENNLEDDEDWLAM